MILIVSDLEGTLLREHSTWYRLNLVLGVSKELDDKLYNDFRSGRITYAEWSRILVKLWLNSNPKLNKAFFEKFFKETYKARPGVREFIKACKEKGYAYWVVSSSFKMLCEMAMKDLGFDGYYPTNELIFNEGLLTGVKPHSFGFRKDKVMLELKEKFKAERVIALGDSDNDINMLKKADLGICVNPSKKINEQDMRAMGLRIIHDLKEVLSLL